MYGQKSIKLWLGSFLLSWFLRTPCEFLDNTLTWGTTTSLQILFYANLFFDYIFHRSYRPTLYKWNSVVDKQTASFCDIYMLLSGRLLLWGLSIKLLHRYLIFFTRATKSWTTYSAVFIHLNTISLRVKQWWNRRSESLQLPSSLLAPCRFWPVTQIWDRIAKRIFEWRAQCLLLYNIYWGYFSGRKAAVAWCWPFAIF
jgi:hypothetical protein